MKMHLLLMLSYCITNFIYSYEAGTPSSLFVCPRATIVALRHILNELATETNCDGCPLSSKQNLFSQLGTFIDTHFGNVRILTSEHIKFDWANDTDLMFLASVLEKTRIAHESPHVVQQRSGSILSKNTVKETVHTVFETFKTDKRLSLFPLKTSLSSTLC